MTTADVRARREQVVLDHFHDEVAQEWDDVLSTFPHPRYEIVHDGDAQVRGYYDQTRVAFPDQRHEMIALRHSEDAVVVDEDEQLIAERIYFDQLTLLRQLLSGLNLKSPQGILKLLAVLRGFAKLAKEPKDAIPDGAEPTVGAAAVRRG